jgi:hypothetical protein
MTVRRRSVLALLPLLISATALAGCGGSGSSGSARSATVRAQQSVTTVTITTAHARSVGVGKHRSPSTPRSRSVHAAPRADKMKLHATVYDPAANRRAHASGTPLAPSASAQNPCTFVTRAEAAAALHSQLVRELEAPLGPTCVLELKGMKQSVTLALQTLDVQRHIAQMKQKPVRLTIAGHTAYCGTLGTSLLYVPLAAGRALQVSAPCGAAQALAAKAIPRIKL